MSFGMSRSRLTDFAIRLLVSRFVAWAISLGFGLIALELTPLTGVWFIGGYAACLREWSRYAWFGVRKPMLVCVRF
jgi:hypothetical protein